eukprot:665796-Pleurochrysis_carterae.AAC.2
MRVFEYATRGFTAKARHPKGNMGMMRGFTPVRHSMGHGVGPKGCGGSTRHQVGTRELHDASNRSLGDAVKLMNVRRTGRGVYALIGE